MATHRYRDRIRHEREKENENEKKYSILRQYSCLTYVSSFLFPFFLENNNQLQ